MNWEVYHGIAELLYLEAHLLDHRRYREWLDLLTDDIRYRMPVRITTERKDGDGLEAGMTYFDETKSSLAARVERLYTKTAWVEDPPPRQRHFISNLRVQPAEQSEEYNVLSYFHFCRSRASEHAMEQLTGERRDVVRLVGDEWRIAERTIICDETVLDVKNLSMFL
ncbi:3-phenylpropionate/cinnamic acid dioxygenase subunit beta [Alicyclobacillus shizuokensis]|uniref:3-phenylpropionate/cinnamic acid dioxygenase subunit beta n=1 Tax=Alicyclobacillus shizuokensis TaxID=392014 RepID=UPI000836240B|nr:3-phenylpropionate/cinnamic acid dioxygenase subunit beta [Alicyclobacillus shizuokensis]